MSARGYLMLSANSLSTQRNGNDPFAQQFFDEGLLAAALSESQ